MPPCHGGDRRFESGRARQPRYFYMTNNSLNLIMKDKKVVGLLIFDFIGFISTFAYNFFRINSDTSSNYISQYRPTAGISSILQKTSASTEFNELLLIYTVFTIISFVLFSRYYSRRKDVAYLTLLNIPLMSAVVTIVYSSLLSVS
jgi:hypothetical protein